MLFRTLVLVCTFLALAAPVLLKAQPRVDPEKPVYMQADKLGYDQHNAIVVAQGNVEVVQGKSILQASRITYYQHYNIVRADGNVRVTDAATGETYMADRVQLKDDLKAGVIANFRVRMADNSQFAAREARKISETRSELKKAVYSPCKICEGKSPLWQLKADSVSIDEEEQVVEYDNLYFEVYGVPVAYSPYFFHPTPDADRKSGFLKPEYRQDSNLGTVIKVPHYVNIAPNMDATVTPILTSDEGPVLEGEYRHMTDSGQYQITASTTYPSKVDADGRELSEREFRGHVFATGHNQLSEHWGMGFDIKRSTDDTYMRKYDYGNYKSLNSRVYAEGLYGRSYITAETMAFQGLQENDDPSREPFVLPLIEGYYESDPMWNGSRWFAGANTQIITRDEGAKSRRLSVSGGYKLPFVSGGGHLYDLQASVRGDVYSVEDQTLSNGQTFDGEETRVIPQVALKWRYPLMKMVGDSTLTIEPTMLAVAQTNGTNPEEIPNEDNRIIEYSDTHLFRIDPMPGLDTVDEGSRIAYGLRGEWLFSGLYEFGFLFGQQYSFEDETPFPYNRQAGEHFSDYVGHLSMNYNPFTVAYHFRLDQDDFTPNSNTFSTRVNMDPIDWRLDYISLDDDSFLQDREEIYTAMAIAISDEWQISGAARRNLLDGDMVYAGAGLTYQNECITILTRFDRQFTRDRDVEPDTSFTVKVSFKNLNDL